MIEGDQAVPAGLFSGGGEHTVVPLTVPVPEGAIVAVTVEQAGGVDQPTQTADHHERATGLTRPAPPGRTLEFAASCCSEDVGARRRGALAGSASFGSSRSSPSSPAS